MSEVKRYKYGLSTLMVLCAASVGLLQAAHAQFDTVINSPPTIIGDNESIGSNTQLNLTEGGSVGLDFHAGAPDVEGNNIEVNISGGSLRSLFAYDGSEVNITGGRQGVVTAFAGSHVDITGGVSRRVYAQEGSSVHLSGGVLGGSFISQPGSNVVIFGNDFRLDGNPIEGLQTVGATAEISLPFGSLTGVLPDGAPFAVSRSTWDRLLFSDFVRGILMLRTTPPVLSGSEHYVASETTLPLYIRNGQTVVVDDGAVLGDYFRAGPGSKLIIEPGAMVGRFVEAIGAEIEISGGEIGDPFRVFERSQVAMSGGSAEVLTVRLSQLTFSDGFIHVLNADLGSEVRIGGGEVDGIFTSDSIVNMSSGTIESILALDSELNISGGSIDYVDARDAHVNYSNGEVGHTHVFGGQLDISGGVHTYVGLWQESNVTVSRGSIETVSITDGNLEIAGGTIGRISANSESNVTIFGTQFELDGDDLNGVTLGAPLMLEDRDVNLAGILADGTAFDFELNTVGARFNDFFSPDATLTVTEVSLLPGDYDSNGTVEQGDLDLVLLNWGEEVFNPFAAGWINDLPTGPIDQQELDKVLLGWGNTAAAIGSAAVPEPASVLLLLLALSTVAIWSARARHRFRSLTA